MRYVSPSYQETLRGLAETLNPRRGVVQDELDFDAGGYAEISDTLCECVIERPEVAQLGRTASRGFGWTDMGEYLDRA